MKQHINCTVTSSPAVLLLTSQFYLFYCLFQTGKRRAEQITEQLLRTFHILSLPCTIKEDVLHCGVIAHCVVCDVSKPTLGLYFEINKLVILVQFCQNQQKKTTNKDDYKKHIAVQENKRWYHPAHPQSLTQCDHSYDKTAARHRRTDNISTWPGEPFYSSPP